MDAPALITIAIGVLGVAGLIFTALRYNRDDTTALVSQQSAIVMDMKALNDELRQTVGELRTERDGLREQVNELRKLIDA